MRAWLTAGDGIDAVREVDVARPRPASGEVLIEMHAWSLNYRDLLVIRGESTWRPERPVVPISDGAGVIVEVGEGASRFAAGDRVSPMFLPFWRQGPLTAETYHSPTGGPERPGVLADYVSLPEDQVERVPHRLFDDEAATLPIAALTAWHAVGVRCGIAPGDRVLVHGTGGVALFATQFATALGAEVMVSTSSAAKVEQVLELGAARAIDRQEQPDVAAAAMAWTDGRGVDHVIETIGGENLNSSLRAVAIGGSIAFIGLIAGLAAQVNTYELVTRNVELHGIETGSAEMYRDLACFIDAHKIRPVISARYDRSDIRSALHALEAGGHVGKIVLT